jgi:hypothetical protein
MRQNNQVERNLGTGAKGEAPNAAAQETEARAAKACFERPAVAGPSMEAGVERESLKKPLARVKSNKGAAGTDGIECRRCAGLPERILAHDPDPSRLRAPTNRSRCGSAAAGRKRQFDVVYISIDVDRFFRITAVPDLSGHNTNRSGIFFRKSSTAFFAPANLLLE